MKIDVPIQQCRSCSAPIVWCITEASFGTGNEKAMPIDAEPVADANVEIIGHRGTYPIVRVHPQAPLFDAPETTYMSHMATCPEHEFWRNR